MSDPDRGGPRFLCIGDIDVDVLVEVDHLPTRDGKVNGRFRQRVPGGMAGNVSAALAKLGASVRILGRVGDDQDGVFALEALEQAGVDTTFVSRLEGVRTFSCIGLITPDGEKSLIKLLTPAFRPSAQEASEQAFDRVTHVHLTSAGDPTLCRRIVEIARTRGATTSLDVETADCPSDSAALAAAVGGFDLLFCNAESRAVLDARLGPSLATLAPAVITTLGENGARIDTAELSATASGLEAEVLDTTGAGDCFAAACLHARLVQGLDWPEVLRFANCAAGLSTEGYGAQGALPSLDMVETALVHRYRG